jgi:sigma-B regulation protein RsbU (phosphoserine phosphatase)
MVEKASTRPAPVSAPAPPEHPDEARLTGWTARFEGKFLPTALAVLLPLLTSLLVHAVWSLIQPFGWFLFYPSVLFVAWIGGVQAGTIATLLSTLLVWFSFVPPEHALIKHELRYILPSLMFLGVGIAFSFFQGRLRKTTRKLAAALHHARVAGKRLRAAHDAITRLVEQASDGIFIADLSGRLLGVNAAACRMLGYAGNESPRFVGQSFEAFISARDVARFWRLKTSLLAGETQIEEWRLQRKDGAEVPVEISAKIFPDGRWQIFARDISERKSAQKRLAQVNRANCALTRCNQALVRTADEQALLTRVCEVVVQEAGYPFCWVSQAMRDQARTVEVIAQAGRNSEYAGALSVTWGDDPSGRGPTGTCIRTRQTVAIRNIAAAPEMEPWRSRALMHGYASSLAIPLLVREEVFGAINIYAPEPDAFDTAEVQLLTELAEDLAFGIEALRTKADHARAEEALRTLNAELEQRVDARTRELQKAREQEWEIGSKIQQTLLLDQPPAYIPGVAVAALALPTQRIDGDFIVFAEAGDRAFDAMVGDVMGKGVPAALLGAATKAHLVKALGQLSASSPEGHPRPEDVVMRAHSEIVRQLIALDSFVTLSYARIDALKSQVELVDCGHTGMIQLHGRTGLPELLCGDNLPLGVREGERYTQETFALEAGDSLFLFSDGITEARNASGELFGPERLLKCIEAQRHLAPAALVEAIRRAVVEHCGSDHLADDVTMVAVRVDETGAPLVRAEQTIRSDLGELHEVREFVHAFCDRLPDALLREESVGALELALNEAASNIMKHAYCGQTDQAIRIEAGAFAGRVSIRLHHCGRSFAPKPVSPHAIDTPRESGLGLYMLSRCVDEIQYLQDPRGGSCILLTKLTDRPFNNESGAPWKSQSRTQTA